MAASGMRAYQHWFTSIYEARQIIEDRRIDNNTERPHSSLKYHPPARVRGGATFPQNALGTAA